MRTRRSRIVSGTVGLLSSGLLLLRSLTVGNQVGTLFWGVAVAVLVAGIFSAFRNRPLPELTVQHLRVLRNQALLVGAAALALAAVLAAIALSGPSPVQGLVLAGSMLLVALGCGLLAVRASRAVRRGEVPDAMRRGWEEMARRRLL